MSAFLGGFKITSLAWTGPTAIAVTIQTDYTDRYLQLYAGRRLIGVTTGPGLLTVVGQLQSAHCPHDLMIVMCDAADHLTDFGQQLPLRPYNQFNLAWSASSYPADAKWFEITGCLVANGAVDPDNVIARVAYIGDGAYDFLLPPVTAPGDWTYALTPRDDAAPSGNAGTAAQLAKYALPYPPDILLSDDTRLTADVAAGVLTVSFAYDW